MWGEGVGRAQRRGLVSTCGEEGELIWMGWSAVAALDWPEVRAVKEHSTLKMLEIGRGWDGLGEQDRPIGEVGLVVHNFPRPTT